MILKLESAGLGFYIRINETQDKLGKFFIDSDVTNTLTMWKA